MKKIFWIFYFTLIYMASLYAQDKKTIFEDNLNNNINNWHTEYSTFRQAEITNGLLIDQFTQEERATANVIRLTFDKNKYYKLKIKIANLNNDPKLTYFKYKDDGNGVAIKSKKTVDFPQSGIVWGFKDWNNYHYLILQSSKKDYYGEQRRSTYFMTGSVVSGNSITHKEWTDIYKDVATKFINIEFEHFDKDDNIYITIDNSSLNVVPLSDWYDNQFGIYIGTSAKVAVDNIIVTVNDECPNKVNTANQLVKEMKFTEAIKYCNQINIEGCASIQTYLCLIYSRLNITAKESLIDVNNLNSAIADCNKALKIEPNNEIIYYYRGLAKLYLKDKTFADDLAKAGSDGLELLNKVNTTEEPEHNTNINTDENPNTNQNQNQKSTLKKDPNFKTKMK